MAKFSFKVKKSDLEDKEAPRRAPHVVLGMEGGGSPFGSTKYKRRRLCPHEDALIQVARLRPARNKEPLDVGWLIHAGLQRYYEIFQLAHREAPPNRNDQDAWRRYLWGARPEAEKAARDVCEAIKNEPGYAGTFDVVSTCISAYLDHYRYADEWRILAPEETLVYQERLAKPWCFKDDQGNSIIQTDFRYSARLDILIHRYDPGKEGIWIVEHKSARMISDDLLAGYQLDMQILGQAWLLRKCVDLESLGAPFKGVIVNIISKHKTPQFERVEVMPSEHHLREFERSTRQWAFMNECFATAGYPRALGSCAGALRGYSKCSFYELCHSFPELGIEDWKTRDPGCGYYREERDLEDYVVDSEIF
jgi:hypothetical protein